MKNIYIILISIFLSINTLGQNQNNDITLITDRSEYVSGENIWFKVHLKAELKKSKIIYAEIISPFGYVVNRKKVLTNNGIGNGNFVISDTVSTGYYTFLIYTNDLKNKEYENFYRQNILIYNPEKKILTKEKVSKKEKIEWSLKGNKLMKKMNNRIYYSANVQFDSLFILENKSDTIIPHVNEKMQYIEFIPNNNFEYSVVYSLNMQTASFNLGIANDNGILFEIDQPSSNKLVINVKSSEQARITYPYIFIFNDKDSLLKKVELKEPLTIPINEDVLELTNYIIIKDGYDRELWKKVINHKHENKNLISTPGLQKDYQTRSKVSFSIKAIDHASIQNANICVSVKKANKSELSNKLINTEYEHLNNNTKFFYQEIDGVIISGQIKNANKEPLAKLKVYLCNVDSVSIIQTSITNNNGRFHFLVPVNTKLKDIVINSESNEDVTIILDNKFINNYNSFKGAFIEELDSQKRVYLNQLYINHRINKLYTINQIGADNVIVNEKSNKNNFYDYPDKVIKIDNYIVLDSLQEYFHEFFPSIFIQKKKGKRQFRIVNNFKDVLMSQPAIFIDGVLYSNNEILFSINPEICDRIEVVKSNYLIYNKIYGGIICLYTKNSDLSKIPLPNNSSRIEYSLYDDSRIFSSIQTNNITPNFQNTLYWNPNIIIGKNNTVEIEFETGDAIGDYIIEIKGYMDSSNFINESRRFTIIREVN